MKKYFAILLLAFAVFGCEKATEPVVEIPDIDITNSLIPLRVGNKWEYNLTTSEMFPGFLSSIYYIFPNEIISKVKWNTLTLYHGWGSQFYTFTWNGNFEIYSGYYNDDNELYLSLKYSIPYNLSIGETVLISKDDDDWEQISVRFNGYNDVRFADEYVFFTRMSVEPFTPTDSCFVYLKKGIGVTHIGNVWHNAYQFYELSNYTINP